MWYQNSEIISLSFHNFRLPTDAPENTLTEVDIRVQPLDIVLSPVILKPFTKVYEPWLHFRLPPHTTAEKDREDRLTEEQGRVNKSATHREPLSLMINNRSLPLLYLHLEGLRVFLPSQQSDTKDTCGHDLLLLQLSSVLISPQAGFGCDKVVEEESSCHML